MIHHVQLACPAGSEPALREFYGSVLGLDEVQKPPGLAARGGCWFRGHGIELHLGVEEDFRPARKAHPGLLVSGLDAWAGRLRGAGFPVRFDREFPGIELHRVPGVPQPPRPGVEPGHEQAGMCLTRGPEILLHAEVKLYAVAAEPAAAARGQRGRFRDLVQPEHAAVELAERRLAARRAGQLHVVDHPASPSLQIP